MTEPIKTCGDDQLWQYEPTKSPKPGWPSDDEIRQLWRAAGGRFYGPHVEHADIEESKFLPFMRGLLRDAARYRWLTLAERLAALNAPCPTCGGCGIDYCCGGDCAQPEPEEKTMVEPSERDWEMARKIEERIIFRTQEGLAKIGLAHVEIALKKLDEYIALFLADARAEGAAEMRERCALEALRWQDSWPQLSPHWHVASAIAEDIRSLK